MLFHPQFGMCGCESGPVPDWLCHAMSGNGRHAVLGWWPARREIPHRNV